MSYSIEDMRILTARHVEYAVEKARMWLFAQGFAAGAGAVLIVQYFFN